MILHAHHPQAEGKGLESATHKGLTSGLIMCRSCIQKKWEKYEIQKRNQQANHGARRHERSAQNSLLRNYQKIFFPTRYQEFESGLNRTHLSRTIRPLAPSRTPPCYLSFVPTTCLTSASCAAQEPVALEIVLEISSFTEHERVHDLYAAPEVLAHESPSLNRRCCSIDNINRKYTSSVVHSGPLPAHTRFRVLALTTHYSLCVLVAVRRC